MRTKILSVLIALTMILTFATPVLGAASQDVTVTATPAFIAIANAPGDWDLNDIVGDGVTPKGTVGPDTYYYSNPLGDELEPSDPIVDGECRFTITNTSTIATDLTVLFPDYVGGDASTNSDDGSNGAATFGAYSYFSGDDYSTDKVVAKSVGSDVGLDALAATTNIKWGLACETQTGAWTSAVAMVSTVSITATAD